MRARSPLAPLLSGLALAACGGGLFDAGGLPALATGGAVCDAGQILCGATCTVEDAAHCGEACADCGATVTPPAGGGLACLREGGAASCGFECAGGLLACGGACCGATALAAGDRHTCALLEGGHVSCWGANDAGQVGDGTTTPRPAPRALELGASAVAIAAGASHACAVTSAGAVRCWGGNGDGQVTGAATPEPVLSPAATPVSSGAVSVAAGAGHTCARLVSGEVRCWGRNGAGQLGPGGTPIPAGSATTALAAGRDHACAIVAGAVRCWGSNASGQLGASPSGGVAVPIASGIQLLAAGGDQTCAATGTSTGTGLDDALRCWGDSLGAGWLMAEPFQATPEIPRKAVDQATVRYEVGLLAAGARYACVRKKAEQVDCLGANGAGQLGGALAGAGELVAVPLPPTVPIAAVALATGASHACAAVGDGRIRCWGSNASGQLGDGTLADPGLGLLATPLGR